MTQFSVRMRCVVIKVVTVECETENEARGNPWANAIDEMESAQVDWEVISVEPQDE